MQPLIFIGLLVSATAIIDHNDRGMVRLDRHRRKTLPEKLNQILGLSLWNSPELPHNVHDPDFLFSTCCAQRDLPAACQARCSYDAYGLQLLQGMALRTDDCPLALLPAVHFCAAQGRDHRACCRTKGVDTTSAGEKCLVFCDQTPDRFVPIDHSHVACFAKLDEMKQCFYSTVADRARSFFRYS